MAKLPPRNLKGKYMAWIDIRDKEPEDGQLVYYWFGFFDCVYTGHYEQYYDEYYPIGVYSNVFYNDEGFLTDDVTWWMPREKLPEGVYLYPTGPTDEQKCNCMYHPLKKGK